MLRTFLRFTAALAVLTLALPLEAQQAATGTISGKVTDAASGRPVVDAQVRVVGTTRVAATGTDGSYRLAGVPVGVVTLRAQRIGYAPLQKSGTVAANANLTIDFGVSEAITTIDQVIITGTGEAQRKRERGMSTATIDSTAFNGATVRSLSNVLQARAPGVTVQSSGGTTGTGSRIRIRGSNSISLANEPLLVVDGILMDNSASSQGIGVGGQVVSRFDDINPDDIENIEVVKGPSATALYGTAAANGVIQITTKRGRGGKTRWNTWVEQGNEDQIAQFPANFATIGTLNVGGARTTTCTIDRQSQNLCTPTPDSLVSWNPLKQVSPFRSGRRNTTGASVSGGNEYASYYLSGEHELSRGIVDNNNQQRVSLRSNVTARPTNKLELAATIGYTRGNLELPANDNAAAGQISQGLLGKAFDCSPTTFLTTPSCGTDSLSRGYFNANVRPEDFWHVLQNQTVSRLVSGLTADLEIKSWLKAVARAGMDFNNRYDQTLNPPNVLFFNAATIEGSRFQQRAEISNYSLNGTLTASFDLPNNLTSASAVGVQYLDNIFRSTNAFGAILLAGTSSLNGTNARFAVGESNQRVRTIGAYVEQRFGWRDKVFATLGLRADDNSAFGTNAPIVTYPAASLSYVISEEGWFPHLRFLDQLRVRTAFGKSGQRPGFRQAFTTLAPVAVRAEGVERAAVTLNTTGNEILKPEITSEIEGGFEASMFGGRLGLDVTAFSKTTSDLLVARTLAPSLGATTTQFANLSEMTNKGIEILVTGRPVEMENITWEGSIAFTGLKNRLVELGEDIPPILFGFSSSQRHTPGQPAGAYFQRPYTFRDVDGNGVISRVNCPTVGGTANPQLPGGPACEIFVQDSAAYMGQPLPTIEVNIQQTVTIMKYVAVNVLVQHRQGNRILNFTDEFRCGFNTCKELNDRSTSLEAQARALSRSMGTVAGYVESARFTRLSEVSVTLTAPQAWVNRLGTKAQNVSLTVGGRNLGLWTNYRGFDPEVNANNGANFTTADFLTQPPTRQWSTRVNINF